MSCSGTKYLDLPQAPSVAFPAKQHNADATIIMMARTNFTQDPTNVDVAWSDGRYGCSVQQVTMELVHLFNAPPANHPPEIAMQKMRDGTYTAVIRDRSTGCRNSLNKKIRKALTEKGVKKFPVFEKKTPVKIKVRFPLEDFYERHGLYMMEYLEKSLEGIFFDSRNSIAEYNIEKVQSPNQKNTQIQILPLSEKKSLLNFHPETS